MNTLNTKWARILKSGLRVIDGMQDRCAKGFLKIRKAPKYYLTLKMVPFRIMWADKAQNLVHEGGFGNVH